MVALLFILFAGLAVGCAISMVAQRNPVYSAISLIGVFISLACLYVTLAAPFIAAVQVIVYAGAIMVLVVFVIMLLNVEEEERKPLRLRLLVPIGIGLAAVLFAETAFIIFFVQAAPGTPVRNVSDVGLTSSIGSGLFTSYLLPFEVTSILLLMAVVGAMTLARRGGLLPASAGVVPGDQVFSKELLDRSQAGNLSAVVTHSTEEAARLLGVEQSRQVRKNDD
jgi:NADH-quinone oxidoreductase subunit J